MFNINLILLFKMQKQSTKSLPYKKSYASLNVVTSKYKILKGKFKFWKLKLLDLQYL